MKKRISLLVSAILMTILCSKAIATINSPEHSITITPRYSYTQTITATLSFSGGKAQCSGAVKPSGNYNCSIIVTLYKQNGSDWDYITSWFGSATGGERASAGGSKTVGNGTYKVVSSADVAGKEFPSKSVIREKE